MQLTVQKEDDYRLPENQMLRAVLSKVSDRTIEYHKKKDGVPQYDASGSPDMRTLTFLIWEFDIVEDGFSGLKAWGECFSDITTRSDNVARQWVEAVTGIEYEVGDSVDTDDLTGLPCVITVKHEEFTRKDGTSGKKCPVFQVFPEDAAPDPEEPPF